MIRFTHCSISTCAPLASGSATSASASNMQTTAKSRKWILTTTTTKHPNKRRSACTHTTDAQNYNIDKLILHSFGPYMGRTHFVFIANDLTNLHIDRFLAPSRTLYGFLFPPHHANKHFFLFCVCPGVPFVCASLASLVRPTRRYSILQSVPLYHYNALLRYIRHARTQTRNSER